jgi:hypothetical protein
LGELSLYGKFYEISDHLFFRRTHPKDSTTANVTEYDLAIWFDPKKKGKLVFPRWRRFAEYLAAIYRAPLPLYEKVLCMSYLGKFLFVPERLAGMLEDILLASRQLFARDRNHGDH